LRIDNPFPSLLQKALSIDLPSLDQTTHSHIPFIYILIQAAAQWRATHNDTLPKTFAERKAFQRFIEDMKMKIDEENFDEASAQAFRVAPQPIPTGIRKLFDDPALNPPGGLNRDSKPFFHLLAALKEYVLSQEEGRQTLPLSANLPDIKSDTKSYVEVQTMYKERAREERDMYKVVLLKQLRSISAQGATSSDQALLESFNISEGTIDDFVKNSHGLTVLRSTVYGALDKDRTLLGEQGDFSCTLWLTIFDFRHLLEREAP
jgi:NEDD8-activating enzyme E1 regulatory subunit